MLQTALLISNVKQPQPFELAEVKDSDGVKVFLAWQSGILDPNGETQVGVLWTPERPGEFTVSTFAISNLNNPQILSLVQESDITIS